MSRYAFVWTNGVRDRAVFDRWNDGLRAALRIIEKNHEVTYHEPDDDLPTVDWILFWEAPCTWSDPVNGAKYRKLLANPQKKALLFAGGPIKYEWIQGFNHIFWESKINGDEFNALGVSNSCAFGVNTDVFKPLKVEKKYLTVTHGTCAGWKRQHLICQAVGEKALVFGRPQEGDSFCFDECGKQGATVLHQQSYEETNRLLNTAQVAVNCADFWGGGQRATLEAMACDLPVVVMSDSPKNREYVEDSGCGYIANADPGAIRNAVYTAIQHRPKRSREYVMSKWSHKKYAEALLNVIA